MKLEPMIKISLDTFKKSYGLEKIKDSDAFEQFANHVILASHQPEAFSTNNELMNVTNVGGQNDMGIDGIAIKINGLFVDAVQTVTDIIATGKKINIELVFIQSKFKEKFDSGEYGKFADGIIDFLSYVHNEPRNEKIDALLTIKDYILSDDVMSSWSDIPSIRVYYVVMGTWNSNEHIIAKTKNLKEAIKNLKTYGDVVERYLDIDGFKKMYDENNNKFNCVLNFVDNFSLTEVEQVSNSMIILCKAPEIVKMLQSSDQSLRKSIFNDNVRDFQGNTSVNDAIMETIQNNPQNFILMNNGVTIVCNEAMSSNRKVTISNPQIVNGCQTCSVIFEASKQEIDISEVAVILKIIATDSIEISSNIVQGNNRQNIVYDEAFETTRTFHKNLDEFINSIDVGETRERMYYERRSKQYINNPGIKATQKVNFRILYIR